MASVWKRVTFFCETPETSGSALSETLVPSPVRVARNTGTIAVESGVFASTSNPSARSVATIACSAWFRLWLRMSAEQSAHRKCAPISNTCPSSQRAMETRLLQRSQRRSTAGAAAASKSTRIATPPSWTMSPGRRSVRETRWPFTNVPFAEPRSSSTTPCGSSRTAQCVRERRGEFT